MKKIVVLVLIVVIGLAWFIFNPAGAPEEIERVSVSDTNSNEVISNEDNEFSEKAVSADPSIIEKIKSATITITGYAPGKNHPGTFTDYEISNAQVYKDTGLLSSGMVTIKSESRNFKIDDLNKHLCAEVFLNCENFPEINFELSNVTRSSDNVFSVTGDLTFLGITKQISFPINYDVETDKFSTDFALELKEFGFNPTLSNSEVRVEAITN
jgi:polyisoprenoid-binding protein YceI